MVMEVQQQVNGNVEGETPKKTPKQLEKEAKKLAKLDKFLQKQETKKEISKTQTPSKKEPRKKDDGAPKIQATYDIPTQPGDKKDITVPMPDAYSPPYVEAAWYAWWEKSGFFKPEFGFSGSNMEDNPKGKFVMVIPPPNVTGSLHLGHALTNSIQDALTRWHRMKGYTTLWIPGCDHAGIATQVIVEKRLKRDEGLTRHDLGREAFINRIWQWKNEKGDHIYRQLRLMGSSYDWSRACFTMDPSPTAAVINAFVQLHKRGFIYRHKRLVHWSCALKSAISDIEVDKMEVSGSTYLPVPGYEGKVEFGILVSFAYEVIGGGEIVVATTRIETMLGDSAVAVHPNDPRYTHLHGQNLKHPFCDRILPIVCAEFVDMEFGTGAVKITPAHDQNDYEVGVDLKLPFHIILDDDGNIIGECTKFNGMKRFEARKEVLSALKDLGLFRDVQDNPMVVPICSRSKDIVEPMLKPQWYVKCDKMASEALESVFSGELEIIPDIHKKTWFYWMEGIRDWCISRQLWWGHRIPAYLITLDDQCKLKTDDGDDKCWVSAASEAEALQEACNRFGVQPHQVKLDQDPDVLDTWFSSALFPFSTLGWPSQTSDFHNFFPGTLLETGHDILFFWVARMVFMSQTLHGKLPFKQVFLHSMIRDSHGRKMSKSLGNIIDPIDVINGITLEELHAQLQTGNLDPKEVAKAMEGQKKDFPQGIPQCGTDALRFALCAYAGQGRDVNLDVLRIQGYRFFCNKVWNAVKLSLMWLDKNFKPFNAVLRGPYDVSLALDNTSVDKVAKLVATENGRQKLDQHLADKSYLQGFTPSKLDSLAFDMMDSIPTLPHLRRWYNHIASHRENRHYFETTSQDYPPSNKEGNFTLFPMDSWLLSRLASAVEACNKAFSSYDFPAATSACYSLWLYDFCDVYLEYVKNVFLNEDEKRQQVVRNVIWMFLSTALRLLSVFMPFLTEELYQRLPGVTDDSITISAFPETSVYSYWSDPQVESSVEQIQRAVHALRSTRSDYNLLPKQKTEVFSCCMNEDSNSLVRNFSDVICTLAHCSSITVVDTPPTGCAVITLSDKWELHILLKGVVDPVKEKVKLDKKFIEMKSSLQRLQQTMQAEDYQLKVPLEIQTNNSDKLQQLQGELERIRIALQSLESFS